MKTPKINLLNMDCMDYMRDLPDKYHELAIIDPPYGLDLANMNMGLGNTPKASKIENRKWTSKDWDKNTPTKEYFDELFRISKYQIIWGGNYFDLPICRKFIIWDKKMPEELSFSDCEYAWTSFSGANKMYRYNVYKDKYKRFHPTQKPVPLYKWILKNYAKLGDKILDTHGGSMSLAIACWDMGFDCTITEIDKEYYDMAVKRFNNHKIQLKLNM